MHFNWTGRYLKHIWKERKARGVGSVGGVVGGKTYPSVGCVVVELLLRSLPNAFLADLPLPLPEAMADMFADTLVDLVERDLGEVTAAVEEGS